MGGSHDLGVPHPIIHILMGFSHINQPFWEAPPGGVHMASTDEAGLRHGKVGGWTAWERWRFSWEMQRRISEDRTSGKFWDIFMEQDDNLRGSKHQQWFLQGWTCSYTLAPRCIWEYTWWEARSRGSTDRMNLQTSMMFTDQRGCV